MISSEPIGLWNTGAPLFLLCVLAAVLPFVLVPRRTRRHWEVAVAIWAAAGFLLLAGAGVFAAAYATGGAEVRAAFDTAPLATSWFFLKLSGYGAVAWVPVLALAWFALAQRVEKRKGEDRFKGR